MPKKNTEKGVVKIPDPFDFDVDIHNANSRYDKKFDRMLLDHLSKGLSFASFDVGVTSKTLHLWLKLHPTFHLARERGEKKRLKLLEAAGMKMIVEGNAVAWKFMMQDYGMTDQLKISVGGVEDDELIAQEMKNITPERSKRLERIRELGKKLKIE